MFKQKTKFLFVLLLSIFSFWIAGNSFAKESLSLHQFTELASSHVNQSTQLNIFNEKSQVDFFWEDSLEEDDDNEEDDLLFTKNHHNPFTQFASNKYLKNSVSRTSFSRVQTKLFNLYHCLKIPFKV